MVDITEYRSKLDVKLQGPNQLLCSLLWNVRSFHAKLKCKQEAVAQSEQKPVTTTTESAGECAKLLQAFGERFQDMKNKQKGTEHIFYTVSCGTSWCGWQPTTSESLSCKAVTTASSLLQLCKLCACPQDIPTLRRVCISVWDGLLLRASLYQNSLMQSFKSRVTEPYL